VLPGNAAGLDHDEGVHGLQRLDGEPVGALGGDQVGHLIRHVDVRDLQSPIHNLSKAGGVRQPSGGRAGVGGGPEEGLADLLQALRIVEGHHLDLTELLGRILPRRRNAHDAIGADGH